MNEKKHTRFVRAATQCVNHISADFEKPGDCSGKVSYDYTDAEAEQIFKKQLCFKIIVFSKAEDLQQKISESRSFRRFPCVSLTLRELRSATGGLQAVLHSLLTLRHRMVTGFAGRARKNDP